MGLLDAFNMQDPESASQMGLLAGLLSMRKGGDLGGLLSQYAQGQDKRRLMKQQEEMQKMQAEAQALQLQQQRAQMAEQEKMRGLAGQFFQPGGMDATGMGPPAPPKQDFGGYANAVMGIDPMKGLGLQAQLAAMNQKESFTLKPGEKRYQGDRVVAEGGPEGVKVGTTREIKSGPNTITYEWDGRAWNKIASAPTHKADAGDRGVYDADRGILVDPRTGRATPVVGAEGAIGAKPAKPERLTEGERSAAGYLHRMQAASKRMEPLEAASGKPSLVEGFLQKAGPGGDQVANLIPEGPIANLMFLGQGRSPERQQYRQAQQDWVRAKLRKESGAAIADSEMEREIATYFPMPGDTPAAIKQKAEARKDAEQQMMIGAGGSSPAQDRVRKFNPATGKIE